LANGRDLDVKKHLKANFTETLEYQQNVERGSMIPRALMILMLLIGGDVEVRLNS
jgi:hypothetical protein